MGILFIIIMYLFFHRSILYLAIPALLFVSGCASRPDSQSFVKLVDNPSFEENCETGLEEVESKEYLQKELQALEKTGNWEKGQIVDTSADQSVVHYDFPVVINKQVQMYLDLFQNKQRKHFSRWLARSGRYLPMMQKELKNAGLPLDLAYLSMIESGFSQTAYSRARAVGLWQFIRPTARLYRLKIDRYIDERRDAEKSTRAAVAFLSYLYNKFGDWYLAVAAYNAGPGKISRGLKKYKTDNFWQLAKYRYLKLETKRYVPKLIAAIIIAKEPKKYGFNTFQPEKPMAYDLLKAGPGLSLKAVALISNGDIKEIKRLNQELRKGVTPANKARYQVKIPPGSKDLAKRNLSRLHRVVSTSYKTHIIRKGETLTRICRRYKINKTTLLKVNNIHKLQLRVGKHLRIPYRTIRYQLLPMDKHGSVVASKDNLILHRILEGDTIGKIAKLYNVPADMIVAWNGLTSIHKIRAGRQLSLYIDQPGSRPVAQQSHNTIALTGKKNRAVNKAASANKIHWYTVKTGDSLWTISRKFNVSTAQIKRWNNLKSNLIRPGNRLKMINV